MELNEAARRILRGHWLIVLTLVLLGTAGGFLIQGPDVKLCARPGAPEPPVALSINPCKVYAAATRLQVDVEEPRNASEAETIAAAIRAIATSPSHVAAALARSDALRNPALVASKGVKVSSVGVSGVSQLTVTDPDPKVAAAVANELANDVIQTRVDIRRTELKRQLAEIDAAVTDRTTRIAEIDKQLEELTKVFRPPVGSPTLAVDPATILTMRRGDLASERATLLQQRLNILGNDVTRAKAAILEPARPPLHSESHHRGAFMGLGFLLALILGVGIAALLESFRPTVIGRQSVARAVGAPSLGHLGGSPERLRSLDFTILGARLRLAAHAARVGTIELLPVDPSVDVARLAEHLQNQLGPVSGHDLAAEPTNGRYLPVVRPLGAPGSPPGAAPGSGLVVVIPDSIKKSELTPVSDVLTITNWPVLGVITYNRPPFWDQWRRDGSASAGGGPTWQLPDVRPGAQDDSGTRALQDPAVAAASADAASVVRSIYESEGQPAPSERQPRRDEDRKGT
jgi:capsular polysaccharide biosynthesis protein